MPWPAPDLPIDFQNATVSADTHPGAHNDTNLTLNDDYRPEINRLGAAVADSYLAQSGATYEQVTTEVTLTEVTRTISLVGGDYLFRWFIPLRSKAPDGSVFNNVTVKMFRDGALIGGTELALVEYKANQRFRVEGTKGAGVPNGSAVYTMTLAAALPLDTNTGGAASGVFGWSIQPIGAGATL